MSTSMVPIRDLEDAIVAYVNNRVLPLYTQDSQMAGYINAGVMGLRGRFIKIYKSVQLPPIIRMLGIVDEEKETVDAEWLESTLRGYFDKCPTWKIPFTDFNFDATDLDEIFSGFRKTVPPSPAPTPVKT